MLAWSAPGHFSMEGAVPPDGVAGESQDDFGHDAQPEISSFSPQSDVENVPDLPDLVELGDDVHEVHVSSAPPQVLDEPGASDALLTVR